LPERIGAGDASTAHALRDALLERHAIEAQVIARDGGLWVRIGLQVYNELGDVERLADAIDGLC
jgi:selenocysteine lyase/cysteine desulfurase